MGETRGARGMLLAWFALAILGAGCTLTGVSRGDEVRLGEQTAAEVERRYRTHEDATVTRFGRQLASVSERPDLPWRFRVIEQGEVNAFALPGGPIYVTSGMMDFTRGRTDQLAAVIAHEVAHISRRHAVEQIQRQSWLGLGIGVLTRGTLRDIATLAANLEELGYSRNQERDADTWGAVYLTRIGQSPEAMVGLMQRLGAQSGGGGVSFLRTHPSSADRVSRLRRSIQSGEISRLAAAR